MTNHTIDLNSFELNPTLAQVLIDSQVFENLIHDDTSLPLVLDNLEPLLMLQVGVDGAFAGFFSLEDLGTFAGKRVVEVHAFILPSMRKYSLILLKEMRNFIFANTSFSSIVTNVSDRYEATHRFLKFVGFKDFLHRPDVVTYNGEQFGMHYLFLEKEGVPTT